MKAKYFIIASMVLTLLASCSSKQTPKHESPKFLAVVDSICEKHSTKEGYDSKEVVKGMHDYVGYFAANENPIFKDLPMTCSSIIVSNALDGSKLITAMFDYNYEEENASDNSKMAYSLHVAVENEYAANDSIPLKEGETYILNPESGLVQYDGMLDIVGVNENPMGKVIDGRSFGTLKIKNASFSKAN